MASFGIDIGTSSIKVVWLERDKTSVHFKSSVVSATPGKGMLSESSLDQEELAQTIRKMTTDAKILSRNAHLALPDHQVFAKVIEMPLLSDKELSSAIYWEAEQHFPVPLASISLDWKILHKDEKTMQSPKMQVLIVGAFKHLLKKYQDVFAYAGINIVSMETEILAVTRTLVSGPNYPTSMIVNIGSLGTSIAIVQKGVLVFLYTIPLGGAAMNRAISSEFGFSIIQAEEYKKAYGMDSSNFGGKIKTVIEPILTSLTTELKKALSFYADKYKAQFPVSQIILCGGTAKLPGLVSFFVEHIGIETAIANPWKSLNIEGVPSDLLDHGPEYTIAIGLALKSYE